MKISFAVILTFICCSCSLINKVAVRTTGAVISSGSDELLTESNWSYFEKSVPANLKMMEGLWFTDQENKELLMSLIKGFGGYAFAVSESKALKDILEDNTSSNKVTQTLLYYEKAIFYGLKYLNASGISSEQFWDRTFSLKLDKVFNEELSSNDRVAILYFAQALGSSINLQRENVSKLGYFNHVKSMLKWVCSKQPNIERGSCKLFDAVIEASTSGILGGNMDVAKNKFKDIIKEQPYNILAKVSYVQYYLIPMLEEEDFSVVMESINADLNSWYKLQLGNRDASTEIFENNRDFNLFNSIAKYRFRTLTKMKKQIFD